MSRFHNLFLIFSFVSTLFTVQKTTDKKGALIFNQPSLEQLVDENLLADNLKELVFINNGVSVLITGLDDRFECFAVDKLAMLGHPALKLAHVNRGVLVLIENIELGLKNYDYSQISEKYLKSQEIN